MQNEEVRKLQAEFARSLARKTNAAVGLNVAILRKQHGMTQGDLGAALKATLGEGWKAQAVSFVERGRRELAPLELLAFAAALGEPAFRLLLVSEGDELPAYEEDWDAERVRAVVLGDDPNAVQPLANPDETSTLEDMRANLRERIAVIEVPAEEAEGWLADHIDRGGDRVVTETKKVRVGGATPQKSKSRKGQK